MTGLIVTFQICLSTCQKIEKLSVQMIFLSKLLGNRIFEKLSHRLWDNIKRDGVTEIVLNCFRTEDRVE
jgi:hypothetical protein